MTIVLNNTYISDLATKSTPSHRNISDLRMSAFFFLTVQFNATQSYLLLLRTVAALSELRLLLIQLKYEHCRSFNALRLPSCLE